MNRREALKCLAAGAAVVAAPGCLGTGTAAAPDTRPPNFVVVLTDDQGYGDLGCYGAKDFETPNIDRLAREGLRFTDYHTAQAVCSASRASLLTGCYSGRVSIQGALGPGDPIGLAEGEETIADVLKKKGYAAGAFGKWHLGHHPEFLPLRHGFDEYFGLPYSNDMWPLGYDGKPVADGRKNAFPPLRLIENDKQAEEINTLAGMDRLTTLYTDRAVRFIEKHKDRPFFLYLAHSMPHTPLGVSDKFRGKSRQGAYGDVIEEIDWSVGRIRAALEAHGLEKRTLIIFTSDNGPWLNFGKHAGSSGPLREAKGTAWEGGVRVPCVMRWPGTIPAGRVIPKLAASMDILPTLAALADAPLPPRPIDGISLVPLLRGDETATPRDRLYYYYGKPLIAVRKDNWKLVFPHTYRTYKGVPVGKDGMPGPYAEGKSGLELYDLASDIGETRDVATAHPDIVRALQALAEDARADLGDSLTNRVGRGVRPPGRV